MSILAVFYPYCPTVVPQKCAFFPRKLSLNISPNIYLCQIYEKNIFKAFGHL